MVVERRTSEPCCQVDMGTLPVTIFPQSNRLEQVIPQLFTKTKLEVEEALKEEPVSTKVGKTILDTEKVDSQTAKTAIYEFLKELYGDFMPEERVSHVKKEEVDALLTKAAQLLVTCQRRWCQTIPS